MKVTRPIESVGAGGLLRDGLTKTDSEEPHDSISPSAIAALTGRDTSSSEYEAPTVLIAMGSRHSHANDLGGPPALEKQEWMHRR